MATPSSASGSAGAPIAEQGMFTRKASGLVREMGGFDAWLMNVIWINLVLGVLIYTLSPYVFPGVNMAVGYLLTTLILTVPILVYAMLAAAMPRSGGEYVYISRIIHPLPGFVFSLGFTIATVLFVAILSAFVSSIGLSSMFTTLGTVNDNQSLIDWGNRLATDNWIFGVGLVTIIVCATLNFLGLRVLMAAQRMLFAFSILGLVVAGILMATTSRAEFKSDFAPYGSYDGVVNAARASGFEVGASGSAGKMLGFLALGFTVLALSQMPAYTAGEVRRPRRNMMVSMIGALWVGGLIFVVLAALAQRTFGSDFLGGMTALFNDGSKAYPDIPPPFFLLYTSMLTHSSTLIVIMTLGVVFALVANIALTILVPSRNVLAYSLDNLLPDRLRETHPRFHSPPWAILLIAVCGVAILIPYVYWSPSAFNFVFSAATLQAIVFAAAAASAIIFPWRARAVFESSPYNHRIGGVPLISILGVIAFAEYVWFAYKLISDDRIGANSHSGLVAIGFGLGAGVVIYAIAWAVNRSMGRDLSAAYKELPPE